MILLVSYPRSGNTFFRNVLHEVYGISSKTFHFEPHGSDKGWEEAKVVKTHERPKDLPQRLLNRKVVYLIRDGRDAVVSQAYHKRDLFEPNSDLKKNMLEAINADEGSYFGGWSTHVCEWVQRADAVIHFEDLIANPIGICEQLNGILELPKPRVENLPTFDKLKSGRPEYGSGKHVTEKNLAPHWFRKGEVNGWKKEMSTSIAMRFWHLHGEAMEYVGYTYDGNHRRPYQRRAMSSQSQINVLFEASKVEDVYSDGIKRYVTEMLLAMQRYPIDGLKVRAFVNGRKLDLEEALEIGQGGQTDNRSTWFELSKGIAKWLLPTGLYNRLARSPHLLLLKQRNVFKPKGDRNDEITNLMHVSLPQNALLVQDVDCAKCLATIHDLTHLRTPETHESNNVLKTEAGLENLKERSASYISVSNHTKNDLDSIGLVSECIYEGVNRQKFYPVENEDWLKMVREYYNLPENQFILSVCTLEPRKNIQRLIEAYARLSEDLRKKFPMVLAGRKGWKWKRDIVPSVCADDVHFIGFVQEAHLPTVYSAAYAFCYVSTYEGFGLPVLEAMACGCPVMVSNNTSLTEVAGDAGVLVDPHSVEAIQQGLNDILLKSDRDAMSVNAIKRSWNFTWRDTWLGTAALYAKEMSAEVVQRKMQKA